MNTREKIFHRKSAHERRARIVESIYGCKWSLTAYQLLEHGINRPGEMVRQVEGLATKVLNHCLRKNMEFGILQRIAYPEVPPRVEYQVTPFGSKFIQILHSLQALQDELTTQEE